MATYLDDLLVDARRRVESAREREPFDALRERAAGVEPAASFAEALGDGDVAVIAEVKRASPSKGVIDADLDAVAQARAYIDGGASAVSVLTEPDRFLGSLDDLCRVASLGAPVLRKDFVVDPYQIWEARAAGASAVLLIVAALERSVLAACFAEAAAAGLDVLVEVHDEEEVSAANHLDARIVGVNARNLRSFAMDQGAFARLRSLLDRDVVAVAESGIAGPEDVRRVVDAGADAVLVGESLVRAENPRAAVAGLVAAGRKKGVT